MMNDRHVLIVSTIADVATDEVVRCLAARGVPHRRLNTEDYPFTRTFVYRPEPNIGENWLVSEGEPLPAPTTIWYRRLRTPAKPEGMDSGIYAFCLQENRAALLGSIMNRDARWMSHPAAVWQAEYKPFQLSLAADLGLSIPRTIVTNDPAAIKTAFANFGSMVVKPTRTGHLIQNGHEFAIFTSRVLEEHLDQLDNARLSPAIYQALVPKRFDLRITIVGRQIFAAAIESQSDPMAVIDWRQTSNPQLPHHPVHLPEAVASLLLRLMDSLRLTFGAIDMIQTRKGEYVFLEVNPSGQWLWLDDVLEFGISEAVANWLAGPTSVCN